MATVRNGTKHISGSWLDFHHPNPREGDYWNDTTHNFTAADWDAKVGEMAALGMDTIVLLSVALRGASFYPSVHFDRRWDLVCQDPVAALLQAADNHQMKVFLGVGFFAASTGAIHADAVDQRLRDAVPAELYRLYGHFRSFHGWYLPVEAGIQGHYPDGYVEYTNGLTRRCRSLDERKKVLIAPYGTRTVVGDAKFIDQLKALEADYYAYQCEVGVRKTQVPELPHIFAALAEAHEKAGKPLWADLEVFTFEGETYKSPLLPAPFSRIQGQLEAISPHVEKILCYQYLGMMNPADSNVFAGHPASSRLYADYSAWMQNDHK